MGGGDGDDTDPEPNARDANGPTGNGRSGVAPNRNVLWGRTIVAELAAAGVTGMCFAPGSRSTPLTVAAFEHPDLDVFSHLDERSAAFFALGRARLGELTPVIGTSGTAAAEFHPAVIEADQARVPLFVLTADRPPELADSGANQTIDQQKLYGDSVRFYRDLPEPTADPRRLRALRVTVARALAAATATPAGPVHCNARFAKPLEPTTVPGDVPSRFAEEAPLAAEGRAGPFVRTSRGGSVIPDAAREDLLGALEAADRGLIVAGPADPAALAAGNLDAATDGNGDVGVGADYRAALAALARTTRFPLLADPLSGLRFGPHVPETLICGGYDSYLDGVSAWLDPDVVLRVGASPTSKVLREYLRDVDARQFLVDAAGGWREATFTATDLLEADPTTLARQLVERFEPGDSPTRAAWRRRFETAERHYWPLLERAHDERFFEGTTLRDVAAIAPDRAILFVSNSMPVRDLDRFGQPRDATLTALANRGASGIDGIVSTALGAGSVTDDPLVCVLGDLAYYHDMNGLLAIGRCGVDATIVLVNNDGGGIFRLLPIEGFDPPFTQGFETPHGLDFSPTADLYGFEFVTVSERSAFREAYAASLSSVGTQVIEVRFDAEASHRYREAVHERACNAVSGTDR